MGSIEYRHKETELKISLEFIKEKLKENMDRTIKLINYPPIRPKEISERFIPESEAISIAEYRIIEIPVNEDWELVYNPFTQQEICTILNALGDAPMRTEGIMRLFHKVQIMLYDMED